MGRPATLNPTQWAALGRDLRHEPQKFGHAGHLWDGKLLATHLRLRYGGRQCHRLFGPMGFRLRKPQAQVAQSDPDKVAAFKKNCIAWPGVGGVELWSVDECHFQQHGTRCRMWVPSAIKDPVLLHTPTRKSVAYSGAVRLRTGTVIRSRCATFNAATFETFLKTPLRHRSRDTRMVLVLDNARDHHAGLRNPWLRKYRAVLTLLFLPADNPQLAPVERVWKLARRLATHNRFFATLNDVLTAVSTCFDRWRTPNSVLRRLCGII